MLVSSLPWDDSAQFKIDDNIRLDFDRFVTVGSDDIVISNGSDTRTIAINDTSQVTFSNVSDSQEGSRYSVTINPTADLIAGTDYNL